MSKSLLVGEYFAETKEDWLELLEELKYRLRTKTIHYDVYLMTVERYMREIRNLEERNIMLKLYRVDYEYKEGGVGKYAIFEAENAGDARAQFYKWLQTSQQTSIDEIVMVATSESQPERW